MKTGTLAGWTLLLVAVVLQGSLAGHLRLLGFQPDLILTAALCLGLLLGPEKGGLLGFAGGILEGVLVGSNPGSFLASRCAAGLLAGAASARLFRENRLVPVTLIIAGTALAELVFFVMSPSASFVPYLRLALGEGIWNSVVALAAYPLAARWVGR